MDSDEVREALTVIESLTKGLDPSTGEVLAHGKVWKSARTLRALMVAMELLRREVARPAWPE